MVIPFNRPALTGNELAGLARVTATGMLSGAGTYTRFCQNWLERRTGAARVLLTQSGTAALEMAAILAGIGPGDEVIMPSYTYVSTANAFVLRGAVPVFVDIDLATLNLDEARIEAAITPRTKAIVPVHYAGVGCRMDRILEIAGQYDLFVIEDAAHGILASVQGRALGSIGHLGILSFHETKNITCGEGGALLVNQPGLIDRAEVVCEKGTDRLRFLRGEVPRYSWVDLGSSCSPSELTAAFLAAQLEEADRLTAQRRLLWQRYQVGLAPLELFAEVRRPQVPPDCDHNGHIYYLLLPTRKARDETIRRLKERGIMAAFHYVPLHSSPFGRQVGRTVGDLANTVRVGEGLIRLPLWPGIESWQAQIIEAVAQILPAVLAEARS